MLAVLALAALLGGAAAANGTAAAVASTKHATVWLGEGRWCGGRCKNCRVSGMYGEAPRAQEGRPQSGALATMNSPWE